MTTTPTPQPERMTAAELRESFESLQATIDALNSSVAFIRTDLDALRDALAHAASQRPAEPTQETITFTADTLRHDQSGKKHAYFLLGGQYTKFGVRIWPEVLPLVDLAEYENQPPDEYKLETPVTVRASVEEYKDKDTGELKRGPRKVIGKA
jgi:hypothetical protein